MEFIKTKDGLKYNAVILNINTFKELYDEKPSALLNTQLYFDSVSVTIYDYDDDTVTLISIYDVDLIPDDYC